MKVWNDFNTVIDYELSFTKIRYVSAGYGQNEGFINFSSPVGGGGYINTATRYVVYGGKNYYLPVDYAEVSFDIPMTITSYTENNESVNNYQFYSEDMGIGEDTNVIDEYTVIEMTHHTIKCRERQQVRPIDQSQDWSDTLVTRDIDDCETDWTECNCDITYRWKEVGEICDGNNKCKKEQLQYRVYCDEKWIDYLPLVYRIGDVIEENAVDCNKDTTYMENWVQDGTVCCGDLTNYIDDNCTEINGKYNLEYYTYSLDNGQTWITPEPKKYRYGGLIESDSAECQ